MAMIDLHTLLGMAPASGTGGAPAALRPAAGNGTGAAPQTFASAMHTALAGSAVATPPKAAAPTPLAPPATPASHDIRITLEAALQTALASAYPGAAVEEGAERPAGEADDDTETPLLPVAAVPPMLPAAPTVPVAALPGGTLAADGALHSAAAGATVAALTPGAAAAGTAAGSVSADATVPAAAAPVPANAAANGPLPAPAVTVPALHHADAMTPGPTAAADAGPAPGRAPSTLSTAAPIATTHAASAEPLPSVPTPVLAAGTAPAAEVPAAAVPLASAAAVPTLTGAAPATGAPASATLHHLPGSTQWPAELGQQLLVHGRDGARQIELRLSPPELGPLSVTLSMTERSAQVHFVAHHVQVREALEQAIPQLREALASQGITLGEAGVSDRRGDPQGSAGFAAGGRTGGEAAPDDGGEAGTAAHATVGAALLAAGRVDIHV